MSDASELTQLRGEMDRINHQLATALHERARLSRRIGSCKRTQGLTAIDPTREREMLDALLSALPDDGFSAAAMRSILHSILEQSRPLVLAASRGTDGDSNR